MPNFLSRKLGLLPTHGIGRILAIPALFLFVGMTSPHAQNPAPQAPAPGTEPRQQMQLRGNRGDIDLSPGAMAVSSADSTIMRRIAQSHYAEIQAAALAQEISTDPKVKNYAQMLIDDHSAALDDLRKVADAKRVILPGGADTDSAAAATALARMTGKAFDQQFIATAGVTAHMQAVKLLEDAAGRARDKDVQAYAAAHLPPVQHHLQVAQQMQGNAPPAPPATPAAAQ